MDVNKIRGALSRHKKVDVEKYVNHIWSLSAGGKNPWINEKSDEYLIATYENVAATGLTFDGNHITLQKTGVSFDYQAYKNKMLLVYPESNIDVELVYTGDIFTFTKDSGQVLYKHEIKDPFGHTDDQIVGGYCVVKNRRGNFLTLLTRAEIDKHRKVARTDYIWSAWFVEMARKTVIKKACKNHFEDIFQRINDVDNESINLENPLDIDVKVKGEIEGIATIEELHKYWLANHDDHKANARSFNLLVSNRKAELEGSNGDS
jgi:hypothetical protein